MRYTEPSVWIQKSFNSKPVTVSAVSFCFVILLTNTAEIPFVSFCFAIHLIDAAGVHFCLNDEKIILMGVVGAIACYMNSRGKTAEWPNQALETFERFGKARKEFGGAEAAGRKSGRERVHWIQLSSCVKRMTTTGQR